MTFLSCTTMTTNRLSENYSPCQRTASHIEERCTTNSCGLSWQSCTTTTKGTTMTTYENEFNKLVVQANFRRIVVQRRRAPQQSVWFVNKGTQSATADIPMICTGGASFWRSLTEPLKERRTLGGGPRAPSSSLPPLLKRKKQKRMSKTQNALVLTSTGGRSTSPSSSPSLPPSGRNGGEGGREGRREGGKEGGVE